MTRRLAIVLAAALVMIGCSSDDGRQADDSVSTVTVPDAEDTDQQGDNAEQAERSVLAFVDTAPNGALDVTVQPGAPLPTSIEVEVIEDRTRSGTVGRDGVATVAYVLSTWDGDIVEQSSDLAERLSVKLGAPTDSPPDAVVLPPPFEDILDGRPVGSRLTVLFPPGTAAMPIETSPDQAHILVLDIMAFQRPENS